jgi:hypothetical protein
VRVGGKVKQRVLQRLGRLDELLSSGQLDSLIQSLGRFSERLAVLGAGAQDDSVVTRSSRIGPALIFEHLWQSRSVGQVLDSLLAGRCFEFSVERAIFLTVLHRLFAPGSDRAAEKWREDYTIEGVEELDSHHLYRAMAWLGGEIPQDQQDAATPLAPRTNKDLIEEELFARRPDLHSGLDVVLAVTSSNCFESEGGGRTGQSAHPEDLRPGYKQMVVGMVLDRSGNPVCTELWPGSTAGVENLAPIVDRLKRRFGIGSVCIVADRGLMSDETLAEVERRQWPYILGSRMRNPMEAQAAAERHGCDALASPPDAPRREDEPAAGSEGYRRYLRARGAQFAGDDRIQEEERCAGEWLLTTNTYLAASEVALKYSELWLVEDAFRSMRPLPDARPIVHRRDETIRGHVFCAFLALLLRRELRDRLASQQWNPEWVDVIRDLDNVTEMEVSIGGKHYVFRGQAPGVAGKVFQSCGLALPPVLRPC